MWTLPSVIFALFSAQLSFATVAPSDYSDGPAPLVVYNGQRYKCKCYPGDSCYPSSTEWAKLNATVNGNLLVALPPTAPCYKSVDGIPTYDAAACANVQANFTNEQWTTDQTVANFWPYWTNETCPLMTNASASCTRGYYAEYVIMAKTKHHIKAAVDFARDKNVRLVIRNTGHDFFGRSTGYGALVINTHSFKDVTFVKEYTGPGDWRAGAATVGAGIQVRELYRLANAQYPPVVVVGGECPTVGVAGGYLQGGGHGPMATFYGMAADHALSFEVLTASGDFVTANAEYNPDLFWALKGGGGSTFGVVLSITVKTFPEVPSASIILNINSTHTNDTSLFYKGVAAFHDLANHWVDHGMFVYYELSPNRFHAQPILGPNMTAKQIQEIAKPLFDKLDAEGVPYSTSTKEFATFFDLYIDIFEDEVAGVSLLIGGWLFTKRDITEHAADIISAYRTTLESGTLIFGHIVGPGYGAPKVDNAIHPKWREGSSFSLTAYPVAGNAPLQEKAHAQNVITNVVGDALRRAGPYGAAYVNEGDVEEPNWQDAYWGSNYPRLYKLKKTWDPKGVFYALLTPGTEDWEVIDDGTRLCQRV